MFTDLFPDYIHQNFPEFGRFRGMKPVSGGDINAALQVRLEKRKLFVKHNSATAYPEMFQREAEALAILEQHTQFNIPQLLAVDELGGQAFLLLAWLQTAAKSGDFWQQFGEKLAQMHRVSAKKYGLEQDNYMGKLPQRNTQKASWAEFWATQRIEPQIRLARDKGFFNHRISMQVYELLSITENLIPQEAPALLHGDLWSGNYMVDEQGGPALIDPALYYGHREVDLAMMHLFGGFSSALFDTYHENFPLEDGWRDRLDFHNLYPVLVHVNLFGGGYAGQAETIIKKYL